MPKSFIKIPVLAGAGALRPPKGSMAWSATPRLFVSALCCLGFVAIYQRDSPKALAFFAFLALVLFGYRRGALPLWGAVTLTLLPLVVVKTWLAGVLPIVGLSFATFRAIDVVLTQEGDEPVRLLDYFVYVFFPLTILAGPLIRWKTFRSDLSCWPREFSLANVDVGIRDILLGVAQKFLFADVIQQYFLPTVQPTHQSLPGMTLAAVSYSAFLYFDFAGYSNMVRGIGAILGFRIPKNFDSPILAANPRDFWRRWHISLSQWLRDVVFMPVYMNLMRRPHFRSHALLAQNIGTFVTLLLMGIWNGIEPHYIASGVLFGLYSVIHNSIEQLARKRPRLGELIRPPAVKFVGRIVHMIGVVIALYVFSGYSPI